MSGAIPAEAEIRTAWVKGNSDGGAGIRREEGDALRNVSVVLFVGNINNLLIAKQIR